MKDLPPALARFPINYLAVYRANILAADQPLYIERGRQFSLALHPGSFAFSVSQPIVSQTPPAAGVTMGIREIQVPPGSYWVVELQFSGVDPSSIRRLAALRVAETLSTIELRFEGIVLDRLFEGAINTPGGALIMLPEGPLRLTAAPVRDAEDVATQLTGDFRALASLPEDQRERFRLASRWFRRGREALNPIDKLLFWWTALEIYPAEGSKKVSRLVSELVAKHTYKGLSPQQIKTKLKLGRIEGKRADVVHKGQAFVHSSEEDEFSQYVDILDSVVTTCLRVLAELPPGDGLDKFLGESSGDNIP